MTLRALILVQPNPSRTDPLARALTVRGIDVTLIQRSALSRHRPTDAAEIVLLDLRTDAGSAGEGAAQISAWGLPNVLLVSPAGVGAILEGMDAGADDFVVTPFSVDSLAVRMAVILRKRHAGPLHILSALDLRMDLNRRTVYRGAREITLSRREFEMLKCLLRNKGTCISRGALADGAGVRNGREDAVKVSICSLRSKLCAMGEVDIIESRRGYGYLVRAG